MVGLSQVTAVTSPGDWAVVTSEPVRACISDESRKFLRRECADLNRKGIWTLLTKRGKKATGLISSNSRYLLSKPFVETVEHVVEVDAQKNRLRKYIAWSLKEV